MALIALSDCKIQKKLEGDYGTIMIITPDTADSNDTIDVSTLVADGQLLGTVAWDVEAGDASTCTYNTSTGVLTIDAAGGTTNHTYAVEIKLVGYIFAP